jgi:hypothetical protein
MLLSSVEMKKGARKPVEFLGTYILPRNTDDKQAIEALVVLHLGFESTPAPLSPALANPHSVTTAMILVGKRDVIKMGIGTHQEHELLGMAGVSQPAAKAQI